MGQPSNLPKRNNDLSLGDERETNAGASIFPDPVRQLTADEPGSLERIAAAIDEVYEEMRLLITRQTGHPGLRDALRPLRDKLRSLQSREAQEISEQYDSRFRPTYEEAQAFIQQAREVLGKR